MNQSEHLLTLFNVAELLAITIGTVSAKRDPNSPSFDPTFPLPLKLSGKSIRYRRTEIEKWLESQRVTAVKDQEAI